MIFTDDKLVNHIRTLNELAKLHYKEVAPYDDIPLSINWGRLLNAEKAGALKFYSVVNEGELVGYAMFSLGYSVEYSSSVQSSLTNIFLHPDYRGLTGIKFIKYCENELKKLGVQVIYHHVKSKNDYGVLLKRLGYGIMNIEYSKRLDK